MGRLCRATLATASPASAAAPSRHISEHWRRAAGRVGQAGMEAEGKLQQVKGGVEKKIGDAKER